MWLVGLVAFGGARQWLASRSSITGTPATVEDMLATSNPYTWVARSYLDDPEGFRRALRVQVAAQLKQLWPNDPLQAETPVVRDLGAVFLTTWQYHGTMALPDVGRKAVRGERRNYAHARGLVLVDVLCATASPGCENFAGVAAHADRAILDRQDALALDVILPAGACERTPQLVDGVMTDTVSCVYASGVSATARMLTVAQARQQVRDTMKAQERR
jgi:hypothetical protein